MSETSRPGPHPRRLELMAVEIWFGDSVAPLPQSEDSVVPGTGGLR